MVCFLHIQQSDSVGRLIKLFGFIRELSDNIDNMCFKRSCSFYLDIAENQILSTVLSKRRLSEGSQAITN